MFEELFEEAIQIYQTHDYEAAKKFIDNYFGEDVDLNIVKCEECHQIIALCANLLATSLTGGDEKVNLAIYKHLWEHPTHAEKVYGYSHGVKVPIGLTLDAALKRVARMYGLTNEEALCKRIAYLEAKQTA